MKKTGAPLDDDKVAAEAMQSRAIDDSDVDEDCEVADLTSIPTPKIGFKLPNLGQPKPSVEKAKKPKKGHALTAELLNNEIVNMRESVSKAQRFASSKLARDVKAFRGKLEKKSDEKLAKKVARLEEDQKLINTLAKDEVAKFALLNKKSRSSLPFSAATPSTERCLYYLATEKPVAKAVEAFRKKYEDWEVRTAYFLQRLGQQYQALKAEKEAVSKVEKEEEEVKDVAVGKPKAADKEKKKPEPVVSEKEEEEALEDEEGDESPEGEEGEDSGSEGDDGEPISDVEMGSGSEDEETTENRRKMLFDLCGIKVDKTRPKLAPKPKKIEAEEEETETKEEAKSGSLQSSTDLSPKDDSKAVLKKIIQKTLKAEAPKSAKDVKQLKSTLKEEQKQENRTKRQLAEPIGPSSTVVKKVKLSEGGVIQVEKSATATENDNESGEDSDTAPVSTFFLSADGVSSRNDNASSGEESVDDDEDMAVAPLPKKGGQMRKMSSARERLQSKLESRQSETRRKLQSHKKELLEGSKARKETTKKPDPSAPETLHPSWAARVEKKKQMENVKPQGKRMVFADDD